MSAPLDERAAGLDRALAETQQQERAELQRDIDRDLRADESLARALEGEGG